MGSFVQQPRNAARPHSISLPSTLCPPTYIHKVGFKGKYLVHMVVHSIQFPFHQRFVPLHTYTDTDTYTYTYTHTRLISTQTNTQPRNP